MYSIIFVHVKFKQKYFQYLLKVFLTKLEDVKDNKPNKNMKKANNERINT